MRRRWGMLGIAAIVAGTLTACTAPSDIQIDASGTRCVDSHATGEAYAGFSVTNLGGAIQLRNVEFTQLSGVEVLDTWVLAGEYGVDISPVPVDIPTWGNRVNAAGSTLPGDEAINLIVHLRTVDPDADGYLSGLTLVYNDGEQSDPEAAVGIIASGNCAFPDDSAQPPVAGGSVVISDGISEACADGSGGGAFAYGIPVTNRSTEPVQLTGADIQHIAGVELIGTWIVGPAVSNDDTDATTSWSDDYPPDAVDQPGWDDRLAVGDATIPGGSTTWLALAIELSPGSETGTAAGLSLDYVDEAGSWTAAADFVSFGIGHREGDQISCSL